MYMSYQYLEKYLSDYRITIVITIKNVITTVELKTYIARTNQD
jgi:hypothetical protein